MTKILLVEDNEMNRDMLSRRLARAGYEVLIAEDGASGVAMAMSSSPDLILMDMDQGHSRAVQGSHHRTHSACHGYRPGQGAQGRM